MLPCSHSDYTSPGCGWAPPWHMPAWSRHEQLWPPSPALAPCPEVHVADTPPARAQMELQHGPVGRRACMESPRPASSLSPACQETTEHSSATAAKGVLPPRLAACICSVRAAGARAQPPATAQPMQGQPAAHRSLKAAPFPLCWTWLPAQSCHGQAPAPVLLPLPCLGRLIRPWPAAVRCCCPAQLHICKVQPTLVTPQSGCLLGCIAPRPECAHGRAAARRQAAEAAAAGGSFLSKSSLAIEPWGCFPQGAAFHPAARVQPRQGRGRVRRPCCCRRRRRRLQQRTGEPCAARLRLRQVCFVVLARQRQPARRQQWKRWRSGPSSHARRWAAARWHEGCVDGQDDAQQCERACRPERRRLAARFMGSTAPVRFAAARPAFLY